MDMSKVPTPPPGMGYNHPGSNIYNPRRTALDEINRQLSNMTDENAQHSYLK
jgi:hypothetical protein